MLSGNGFDYRLIEEWREGRGFFGVGDVDQPLRPGLYLPAV
jgi:hypothetical protein